jgi:hypothetical protein
MVLKEKQILWYRVLCARYGEARGRLCLGGSGGLVWWKTVNDIRKGIGMLGEGWLTDNISKKVGDESSTLF